MRTPKTFLDTMLWHSSVSTLCHILCSEDTCLWPKGTLQWVKFLSMQPCPKRFILSGIHFMFSIGILVSLLQHWLHPSNAGRRKKVFKPKSFTFIQLATLLFGLLHTVITIWSFFSGPHQIRTLLSFSQVFSSTACFMALAFEERYALDFHLRIINVWWTTTCIASSVDILLYIVSFIMHVPSSIQDFLISVSAFIFTIACLVASPDGHTNILYVEEEVGNGLNKPLLSNGDDVSVTEYAKAGMFSKALFLWMDKLLETGSKRTIQLEDIPQLMPEDQAEYLYNIFQANFNAQNNYSVALALIKSRLPQVIFTGFLNVVKLGVMYVGPLMIEKFINFAAKPDGHWYEGVELVSILLFAKLVEEITERQRSFLTWKLALSVRSTLVTAVFRKSLRVSNSARRIHGTGQIVNYMSVDVEEISNFVVNFHNVWLMPIQIIIALVILFNIIGVSTVAGLGSMTILMGFCLLISSRQKRYWKDIMSCKDVRIKATNEAISNMKIIKMQAWQEWFLKKVEKAREHEQTYLKKLMYISATSIFFLWLSPLAVSVATFGMCVLIGKELTAGRVFTAIATFRILQDPLRAFPSIIMAGSQAVTALARLKRYLESEEIDLIAVQRLPYGESYSVVVEKGCFRWDSEDKHKNVLENINIHVSPGALVAVVGPVGAGKSSLLACILGEMDKVSGTVKVSGQVAYVPQSPWIQNGTIRENILFGKPMDTQLYRETIQVCSLESDLCQFINGDLTVIGERGFNLSGGQKQRIQLARALYQDADIYLLDDIFSAVDAHTGTALFTDCVRGVLAKKTVILVTRQIEFLHGAELILVMREGKVVQSGKFEELLAQGVHFADLVNAHNQALESISINQTVEDGNKEVQLATKKTETMQISNNEESSDCLDEERAKGRVDKTVYWSYITQAFNGMHVLALLIIQSAWQALQIASDFWLAYSTSEKNKPFFNPKRFILVYTLLAIGSGIFVLMRSMLISFSGIITAQKLYLSMLRSIFRAPISFFDATPTGRILTRSSTDQLLVDVTIPFTYGSTLAIGFQLIGVFIVTSGITWQLVLILLPLAVIYLRYQSYFIATSRELTRLKSIADAPVIHHFKETISGLMTIRAFGHEERFADVNAQRVNTNVCISFHYGAANNWLSVRLETIGIIILCSSALFLVLLPKSFVNPEFVGLSLSYGLALSGCLNYMIFYICQIEQNMVAVERILQYSSIEPEQKQLKSDAHPDPTWPENGNVAVQNLQVRYRPNLPLVLKGLNFVVQGGEKLGVVGRTGSGKSSFIQALFRLIEPVQGTIFIDGIDIQSISLDDLRSRLSIIPQDPTLFEGTVRVNIDPLGIYQDQQIWEALEKCQLAESVKQKELGLDAQVAENGENWSMGQRQLFALGRVLLKRSRILVLDEATASIDTQTDWILQQTIKEEFLENTVISIAHRIPSVMDSDKVLVLDNGEVKEFGAPSSLLARRNSLFAGLVHEYWNRSKSSQNLLEIN